MKYKIIDGYPKKTDRTYITSGFLHVDPVQIQDLGFFGDDNGHEQNDDGYSVSEIIGISGFLSHNEFKIGFETVINNFFIIQHKNSFYFKNIFPAHPISNGILIDADDVILRQLHLDLPTQVNVGEDDISWRILLPVSDKELDFLLSNQIRDSAKIREIISNITKNNQSIGNLGRASSK